MAAQGNKKTEQSMTAAGSNKNMRFESIASGSSGNCIYVGSDRTHLLMDVGISRKRTGRLFLTSD